MAGPAEETAVAAVPATSPADGVSEETASPAAVAARPRGFRLLGEDKSVHKALGGGKTADVLLWKDKKISAAVIGGVTVLWVLFEVVDYHLLALISHVLIGALAILFLWSNATVFIKKSPPDVPEVQISEDLAVNIARALRADINKALRLLREIALGHDLMKFLGVIVALWILSEIGSLCDFLTLIYAGVLMLHTVPILYHKYQEKVDDFAGKAHAELCKQYQVLDAKVLSKIPRSPPKDKKQN
ncbi:reticulon-like protein B2 [Phragmites australis]|uniref:reticulon-like protein B2 n=1 Tax=Phragmites australis TaxID=29695 RepID=UPI002D7A230F|nr:reticulon-like protein B2 [Phragmites australis]